MIDAVRQAFRARPHLVDLAQGFVGMQVMSPLENPAEIWLVTRWADANALAAVESATNVIGRSHLN